jgi:hypothetical protein
MLAIKFRDRVRDTKRKSLKKVVLWWWCLGWRERTTRKEEIEERERSIQESTLETG